MEFVFALARSCSRDTRRRMAGGFFLAVVSTTASTPKMPLFARSRRRRGIKLSLIGYSGLSQELGRHRT